jgi:thiol:disulfide interchange protein DsbD
VFVYFTADWCLTCKVNEHVVFENERVRTELDRLGFASFVGDWTRRDEAIRLELARHGRAGVPLYLVYSPFAPDKPIVLPEVLTVDLFLDALAQAAPAPKEDPT